MTACKKSRESSEKIDVPAERQFVGFDAYKQVIASGVDVVLLTTPPHFRPLHLQAAIEAGKHVFAEKPCAVDAPGVQSVLRRLVPRRRRKASPSSRASACAITNRYREAVRRIHDGEIGDVRTLLANDYRGTIWAKPRQPDWTDMHFQMRNWYYFTWLSGDFNVEQHVHNLDVCAWVMGDQYPVKAVGMGGRQVRTGPEYGNIYDHHSVVYEYANGARLISNTRQMAGCKNDISVNVLGSRGTATAHGASQRRAHYGPGRLGVSRRSEKPLSDRARRTVRQHPRRQADQQRRVHGQEHAAGDHGPHGHLHRPGNHLGHGLELAGRPHPARYDWGDIATPAIAVPGVTRVV